MLRCADGTLYTGITKDLGRRTKQHNAGTASRYTRSRRPVKLVYQEPQRSQSLALRREAAIKRLTRREKLVLVRGQRADRMIVAERSTPMPTNQILRLLPMAALCLLLTSCFDSKVPLSDPGKSKADERLSGSWQLRNDDGSVNSYRFVLAGGRLPASVMRVTGNNRKPDGTTEQFEPLLVFPTTIGDKTYLNACDGKEPQVKVLEEKGWTDETVAEYSIFRYQVVGDTLTVQWMDGNVKKRAIEAGKIKGKIEKDKDGNDRAHFTGTAENLAKFVVGAGDDLFSKNSLKLQRAK